MSQKQGRSEVAKQILTNLKDPFSPKLVKFRKAGGNTTVAYIDARDVMKRLDDVMGTENWKDDYEEVENGFLCRLSLRIDGEWITKANGANRTKIEPVKGGISSALKRAAVEWGVGRYLYYFDLNKFGFSFQNKDGDWPDIFLPGAPEDWEETAEREYGESVGMDEEAFEAGVTIGQTVAELKGQIRNAESMDELNKVADSIKDATIEKLVTDELSNKADELTRDADES